MPLHVADASHGLQLRVASTKLIEVPELALLQQVLAATVSRELVSHPAGEETAKQTDQCGTDFYQDGLRAPMVYRSLTFHS